MYIKDDHATAKIGDRLIAAVIGGLCGYFFGGLVGYLTSRFLGSDFGLAWWFATGFAVFAFLAPSRSREMWSGFWEGLLKLFSSATK